VVRRPERWMRALRGAFFGRLVGRVRKEGPIAIVRSLLSRGKGVLLARQGICFLEWTDSISDPADGRIDPVALLICRRTLFRKVLVEGQPQ
jgi:hypothetical protein